MSEDLKGSLQPVRAEIDDIDAQLDRTAQSSCALCAACRRDQGQAWRSRFHLSSGTRGTGLAPFAVDQPRAAFERERDLVLPRGDVGLSVVGRPLAIAFLGPLGTFSESAAGRHFGHAARGAGSRSTTCSAKSRPDMPIMPWCRSRIRPKVRSGAHPGLADDHAAPDLRVVVLRIIQHLLSKDAALDTITKVVFTRPVAGPMSRMAQSLYVLPNAQRIPMGSNAQAAQAWRASPGRRRLPVRPQPSVTSCRCSRRTSRRCCSQDLLALIT